MSTPQKKKKASKAKDSESVSEPVLTTHVEETIKDKNGKVTDLSQVYSVNAMACRRVKINNIKDIIIIIHVKAYTILPILSYDKII